MINIDVSNFTCNRCTEGCRCIFNCGNNRYCADIEIYFEQRDDTKQKMAIVKIHEFDNNHLGRELHNFRMEVLNDEVSIPTEYFECINLQQDCNCK